MKFDFRIEKIVKKLMSIATKRFQNRHWYIKVTFWQDTDYRIELTSAWGDHSDVFEYHKSCKRIRYYRKINKTSETVHEEILK